MELRIAEKGRLGKLDKLDHVIIERLQEDGRATVRSIAKAIDASEVTVRRRLNRLIQSKVVQIMAIVDHEVFGYEVIAEVGLEVETGKVKEVSRQLSRMDEVFFVAVCTGKSDIICWVVLPTKQDLLTFLTEKLARIAGIKRSETSTVLDLVKRAPSWGIARSC